MKKISVLLIIVFLLSLCPQYVHAAGYSEDNVLEFDRYGNLVMTTLDKNATSTTKHSNIGWTMSSEDKTKHVVISFESYKHIDLGNGYSRWYYQTNATVIYNRVRSVSAAWANALYSTGGNLWFDGVNVVVKGTTVSGGLSDNGASHWGTVYYDYDGIENAAKWATPDGLESHFNKKAYLPPHQEMLEGVVNVKHFKTDGTPLDDFDYSDTLSYNSLYECIPDNIPGYDYKGYKAGYDATPSGPIVTTGNVKFTYKNTFLTANINLYYAETPLTTSDSPETGSILNANVSGFIKADDRGSEKFDVTKGIPTTENLYANVLAKNYLYDYQFTKVTGQKDYSITVNKTYNLSWEDSEESTSTSYHEYKCTDTNGDGKYESCPGHTTTSTTYHTDYATSAAIKSYTITRTYSYWIINKLDLYGLNKAILNNYALPSGSVTLTPQGYAAPSVDTAHSTAVSNHILEPSYSSNITIPSESVNSSSAPDESFYTEANNAIGDIKAKNDRVIVNGTTVMTDAWYANTTQEPGSMPLPATIDKNVLYKNALKIDAAKLNGVNASTGNIYYQRISTPQVTAAGANEITQAISGINSVTVHTPVVCDSSVLDGTVFNQMINPDTSIASLVLDKPSKFQLPTQGQHLNILGYGNKDYAAYTKDKQVKFPFDVYINTTYKQAGNYLKANTWYTVPTATNIVDFYIPTWVSEGNYTIEFREVAINAPDLSKTESAANLNINNYVATDTVNVQVSGRLYGFRITDVADYPLWESVFRSGTNSNHHTANYYWVGTKDENGDPKSINSIFTLPILNGSHPKYKNKGALKTGYKFTFELNSVGNYFNEKDCIKINPTFWFVKKDGTGRQQVDIYYNERFSNKENYFVKVGSTLDNSNMHMTKLGTPSRNVPDSELTNTSNILGISKKIFANQDANLGWYNSVVLTKPLRTFIGDGTNLPTGVTFNQAVSSVQHWYGEYWLPDQTYAVPKGYDVNEYARLHNGLDGKEAIWLKDGYIVVNFDIAAVKNGDFTNPALSYFKAPGCNMWQTEGFNNSKTDYDSKIFSLSDGDTVFYYANQKSSDDYSSGGTH